MLSIGTLGASRDQLEYYERQVAAGIEDYYAARQGAGVLDRQLLRWPRGVGELEAHERAVEAALRYVEREACFTRRGRKGVVRVHGEGFVAAAYRYRLSRAGDPQLHMHVVVANMTRGDKGWTTLEAHGLYEHVSVCGAVYRAVLRAEVRERLRWVWWRDAGRGLFEIDGVPAGEELVRAQRGPDTCMCVNAVVRFDPGILRRLCRPGSVAGLPRRPSVCAGARVLVGWVFAVGRRRRGAAEAVCWALG